MKYTKEWVKEKCYEIMDTIYGFEIEKEKLEWDENSLCMSINANIPTEMLEHKALYKTIKNKYGEENTFDTFNPEEQEVSVYIDNVDFQIWIGTNEIVVRLYYSLECANCIQKNDCDTKQYSWEDTTCKDYKEKGESDMDTLKKANEYKRLYELYSALDKVKTKIVNGGMVKIYNEDQMGKETEVLEIAHYRDKELSKEFTEFLESWKTKCIKDMENL